MAKKRKKRTGKRKPVKIKQVDPRQRVIQTLEAISEGWTPRSSAYRKIDRFRLVGLKEAEDSFIQDGSLRPGTLVVRGPDWVHDRQDSIKVRQRKKNRRPETIAERVSIWTDQSDRSTPDRYMPQIGEVMTRIHGFEPIQGTRSRQMHFESVGVCHVRWRKAGLRAYSFIPWKLDLEGIHFARTMHIVPVVRLNGLKGLHPIEDMEIRAFDTAKKLNPSICGCSSPKQISVGAYADTEVTLCACCNRLIDPMRHLPTQTIEL